jgi:hypothetical protein
VFKATGTKIIALNLVATTIASNHFNHSHFLSLFLSFSFLFSYIDILQVRIEFASKIPRFFCKENLTQFFTFFYCFGTPFARAKIMPNFFGTRFAEAAILAEIAPRLPFWQF